MSWLQKRPQVSQPSVFYTVGVGKTILIVGLGNPGQEYVLSRHNVGFQCIDFFTKSLEEFKGWVDKKDLKCQFNSAQLSDKRVLTIKPTTYMNDSGQAVTAVAHFYRIDPSDIIVIHDELDIDFGQIRTRIGGSDAGHNGIKSITNSLGTDNYGRIRVGVGPKEPEKIDSADFVLANFSQAEREQLPSMHKEVSALLSEYIYGSSPLNHQTRSFLI